MSEEKNTGVSRVRLKTHAFITLNCLAILGMTLDYYNVRFAGLLFYWIIGTLINEFNKADNAKVFYALCGVFSFFGKLSLFPLFGYWVIAHDQEVIGPGMKKLTGIVVHKIAELLKEITWPTANPMMGANDLWLVENVIDVIRERYENFVLVYKNSHGVMAAKMRKLGIAEVPIPHSQKPAVGSTNIEAQLERIVKHSRMVMNAMVVFCGLWFFGVLGVLLGLAVVLCQGLIEEPGEHLSTSKGGNTVADGVYRITNYWMGFPISHGTGTAFGGVLHVPFHVCHGSSLVIGRTKMSPYYASPAKDLVTYGGPPNLSRVESGEEVLVNCETEATRVTYRVNYDLDKESGDFTWTGVTRPGESGSPIFVEREGVLVLVGLAGRYIRDVNGSVTEFALQPPEIREGTYRRVVIHPGGGKTRKIVPRIVQDFISRAKGKRILITGPTRVVCKELYDKISELYPTGLNIKGSEAYRNVSAVVQIAAHATAFKMLLNNDRAVRNIGCIIIDEAHFEDPSTIMLRNLSKHLNVESDVELVEMSATLDGELDDASNFDIVDEKTTEEITAVIDRELEKGHRVMVFVAGAESKKTKELMKHYREKEPVLLSRKRFQEAMQGIRDLERRLIITTDIAECGINVPDLDVVIDTCLRFRYIYNNGVVEGRTTIIGPASRVQRRGRVGRTKSGRYVYYHDAVEQQNVSAAELDAQIGMTGRSWSPGISNPLHVKMTDMQFKKWVNASAERDEIEVPTGVWLLCDHLGEVRQGRQRSEMVELWKQGDVDYIGCNNNDCGCRGKYRWFDERLHDRIFNKPFKYDY